MNASCEFDVESLRPTYRLLIGIPGKSNAFAISQKLGLPDFIIEKAKEQISSENESFEDVISDLEHNRIVIENERREIAEYKEKIRTLQEQLHAKNEKLDQVKDRIIREANEQARDILQEAKDFADETIRDINKAAQSGDVRTLESHRSSVRKSIDDKNAKLSKKSDKAVKADAKGLVDPAKLKKGDSVRIISMNLKGTVATLPDAKGNLFVLCGIIRTQTNVKDLAYAQEDEIKTPNMNFSGGAGKLKMSKAMNISAEINLLGRTGDEAISELEKYLDDAYIAHLPSVRIVHGKGTGALRTAVHNYLRRQKHVANYRLGEYGEGDAGVTIVTFK